MWKKMIDEILYKLKKLREKMNNDPQIVCNITELTFSDLALIEEALDLLQHQ